MRAPTIATLLAMLCLPAGASGFQLDVEPQALVDGQLLLSPPNRVLPVRPDTVVRSSIILSNRTARTVDFQLDVSQAVASADPREIIEIRHGVREGAAAWAELERDDVRLPSRGTATIGLTFRVPRDAPPGSESLAVSATHFPDARKQPQAGLVQTYRLNSIFVLELPGEAEVSGDVTRLALSQRLAVSDEPTSVYVEFANTGRRVLRPVGRVVLRNLRGDEVRSYPLPRFTVYPDGKGSTTVELARLPRFGRFSVRAEIESEASRVERDFSTLWTVPPWWLWGALCLLAAGVLVTVRALVRRRRAFDDDGFEDELDDLAHYE